MAAPVENFLQGIYSGWAQLQAFFMFDPARLTEPEMILRLTLQVLLLLGSSFFSGSETALFSLSRLDLQNLRRKHHQSSETLHALLDQPRRLIISLLCGNELVNIAASINMAGILVLLYGEGEQAFWVNILVMVPLLLLFGEVTPKTVAVSHPVWFSTSVASPLAFWVRLITPLRTVIRAVADRATTYFVGEAKARENLLQVDEFRSLVEDVAEEGMLDATERALIYNLLEAGDVEVVEIMTPRTRTRFLSAYLSTAEVVEKMREYRHARVPVFKDQRDNLVGFVHAEDLLRLVLDDVELGETQLLDIVHPPVVVPLTKKVDEMFDFFQQHNVRAAAVLNEFGGVEGMVTLTDVLTFIFGPITDQVSGQELYQERDENVYEVPGEMKLNDFNNLTHFGIEDPRMTTIGGVVFRHLDRLPVEGDRLVLEDIVCTVLEMDGHRIARLRVVKGPAGQDDAESAPSENESPEKSEQPARPEEWVEAEAEYNGNKNENTATKEEKNIN